MKMPAPGKDPNTGRFTSGNRWWEVRSSHGANPKFKNAEDLQDACREYFEWNDENPLIEAKLVSFQGSSVLENVPKMRAMSLHGLTQFLGVTFKTWHEWRSERPDLGDVIAWAEQIIFRQKFEGASADLLNASIIARDLGLADKKEHTSPDGTMTPQIITRTIIDPKDDESA